MEGDEVVAEAAGVAEEEGGKGSHLLRVFRRPLEVYRVKITKSVGDNRNVYSVESELYRQMGFFCKIPVEQNIFSP